MPQNQALQQFIKARPHLVWYVKDVTNLSEASIVEHTLNYGTWQDVQELFRVVGIHQAAQDFRERTILPRTNYRPEIKHYFELYFNRHVA